MARNFSTKWIRMATLGAAMVLAAAPAQAQFVCDAHDNLVARLAEAFQERQIGYGVVGNSAVIEVFVSATGTWTMTMTDVRGRSCIVAAGDGWESTLDVVASDQGR
ncbi:hypothetical protein [Aminobacter sp. HY435]|uniref:hypothetical protein n=1 Tax=Aminobacter sp. HY435 TaxID=2970917 RepID=UPI0022B99A6A|nr:hypothetical protein [Aminobacter sp. HY435]